MGDARAPGRGPDNERNGAAGAEESAILVGVQKAGEARWEVEDSLSELALLADTAGAKVTDRVVQQVDRPNAATYLGSGKVTELAALAEERDTDLVVFDDDLSPNQIRNLERAIGRKLIDRSALILDIFARHARSATAKTQVELAQLEYLRTRLTRQWTHLSRQKGGIGTKGPGETQIETDRRLIGHRIATLRDRLDAIDRQRKTQRRRREDYTRVSLVGYTNAGKSTLMNALAHSNVRAEDRLFATLDATTRLVQLASNKQILLSDTVGFIRKLPHRLIESFKSTLDEVREADALVHVVDTTHPRFEDQMTVVSETLAELGAVDKPTLLVFNKLDAVSAPEQIHRLKSEFTEAAFVSALRGIGLGSLRSKLLACVEAHFIETVVCIPVTEARAIAHIRRVADVISEEYLELEDDALGPHPVARLHIRVSEKHYADLRPMLRSGRSTEFPAVRGNLQE
jgi:GTP-binding protein HflX